MVENLGILQIFLGVSHGIYLKSTMENHEKPWNLIYRNVQEPCYIIDLDLLGVPKHPYRFLSRFGHFWPPSDQI